MIKMIVSDVDGTLLSHGYINPKCIESIKKAQAKGIEFVVASGRDYYGVTSVLDPLDIKCSAILGNGAQYCNKEGKAIARNLLYLLVYLKPLSEICIAF